MRFVAYFIAVLLPALAMAQERRPSHCIAVADSAPGLEYVQLAGFRDDVAPFSVRLTYLSHAMFLLQTPGGLSAVTDYTGFLGSAPFAPTVATMNNAHGTHWTPAPDPDIPHVLEGWALGAEPRDHHLDLGEMLVRNVHTDVRSGDFAGMVRPKGNSIFIFEVEGLCIGHLGHLHHYPDPQQLAAMGRLDVVMAAVDGGATLDHPTLVRLLRRLRSSIIIPMHWFSGGSLEAFLAAMAGEFEIDASFENSIEVSLRGLPPEPTVVVLAPRFLTDD